MAHRERKRMAITPNGVSLTQPASAASMDINDIIKRNRRNSGPASSGQLQNGGQPSFMDISAVDYLEQLNTQVIIKQSFGRLPAEARAAYGNDPYTLLRALQDPSQKEKLQAFGILQKPSVATPPVTTPVNPPA